MSTDSGGGAPQKKMTTAEILAKARAEKAAKAAAEAPPAAEAAAPPEAAPVSEAPASAPASPAAKPKSTSDILAAARAAAAAKAGGAAPAPAAASAAKPKSTADILAAARATAAAKAGGGDAPAAADKPTAAPKVAAAAVGPKPSVQEMLAAVRSGAAKVEPAAAKEPVAAKVAPPMPARPAPPAAKKAAVGETRRGFLATAIATCLSPFWLAWASFAAASAASGLACLRFMLPNVLTEPPSKFKVGPPADYDLGTVSEKWKAQFGIWIVHTDKYQGKNLIYALSTVCTHLGCTPSWLDGEQKYKCPCHGSGFYINGINFEGPAPRPLERVGIRKAEDGMLEVDKSLKFQEEMGQWNDPASYVEV